MYFGEQNRKTKFHAKYLPISTLNTPRANEAIDFSILHGFSESNRSGGEKRPWTLNCLTHLPGRWGDDPRRLLLARCAQTILLPLHAATTAISPNYRQGSISKSRRTKTGQMISEWLARYHFSSSAYNFWMSFQSVKLFPVMPASTLFNTTGLFVAREGLEPSTSRLWV